MEKLSKRDSVQILIEDGHAEAKEIALFFNSEDIPKTVRESVLEMIRSLKKKYINQSNDSDSTK